ncbi:sugar metabolism cluster protein (plasmid) [Pseudohalocynthiibacter aestuariivivens]|uniref:PEP-utilizing enzyme n=1 Tax=Roseovarius pelagicus TaxID=2980108 RepID=A0ABY6D5L3_9RHOB|nr:MULTISPECIES: PEP/pyruvate-binding domain-containing protein [Rhodobacterales]QIE47905.1 sugar metabolism cluster protein [Pseudohalocynthiibacter aestuariivivens]UXX81398.1 PEP-utilizing enzyme [Roseovarius pelagicus]
MTHSSSEFTDGSQTSRLIILNAGTPHQSSADAEAALSRALPMHGKRTLDWIITTSGLKTESITIVSGYQTEETRTQFSEINVVENRSWRETGSAGSLFCVDLDGLTELLVCYGDILFRDKILRQLRASDSDLTVAWDSQFRTRYTDRQDEDLERCEKVVARGDTLASLGDDLPTDWASGEFIGLVRFSGEALRQLAALTDNQKEMLSTLSLARLVEWFRIHGHSVRGCDVGGDWAELKESHDIARFVLGTKAESLARLSTVVKQSVIQPQISFDVAAWEREPDQIIDRIRAAFEAQQIIVRSSAKSEDSFLHSNAGAYTSLLNIDPQSDLHGPIDEVCDSYENKQIDDQVLVQPMVPDVVMSGVAFTRTLDFGAPYYVINYAESTETDAITAGKDSDSVTYVVRRDIKDGAIPSPHLKKLLCAIREIEWLLSYDALDIEFAIDADTQIHILQVRPITVKKSGGGVTKACLSMARRAEKKWKAHQQPRLRVKGDLPIYGVMPDWNPAEIIGTNAGNLAASLYRYLITDDIWATQRAEYGYKDVRPQPLLVNFCGKNYVDVRASFNSFIPANVSDALQEKLANVYLRRLRDKPQSHDKVEFDILPTCMSLGTVHWRDTLAGEGISDKADLNALEDGLRQITQNGITRTPLDLAEAEALADQLDNFKNTFEHAGLARARYLLEECRLRGTLPFAHLARSGFVAVTLLRDAVAEGVLSQAASEAFLASIRTVSHEIVLDAARVADGALDWDSFVGTYGHLRPGTYDIQSPAYAEAPEHYLRPMVIQSGQAPSHDHDISLWDGQKQAFFDAVSALGIAASGDQIETFLRQAIEGREKSKFIFTRYLSAALDDILLWGKENGLGRETLSHLHLSELMDLADGPVSAQRKTKALAKAAKRAAKSARVSAACQLPELITSKTDFSIFRLRDGQPNFIGTNEVRASNVALGTGDAEVAGPVSLEGCIVMIPMADPGYDWLFGQNIAGLITMYGGANSHMAIRAAEFALPAAIGVGEKIYNSLVDAHMLELSPRNKTIRVIS